MTTSTLQTTSSHELRFQHLHSAERCYAFPCDAQGHVDMDTLSERMLNTYLYARALMGRETAAPVVCRL